MAVLDICAGHFSTHVYITTTFNRILHTNTPAQYKLSVSISQAYWIFFRETMVNAVYLVFKWQLSQVAMGQPGTSWEPPPTPPCQSQVRVVPSCHGTTQEPSPTLHHPASPRSELSQVAMGQLGTSRKPPTILHHPARSKLYQVAMGQLRTFPYLTLPCQSQVQVVPSCHGATQDIPGSSHYLIPPGPSCPKLPWDNPGHSTTLHHPASPRSELYQVAMGQPRTSWEVPTILYHPASPRSKLSQVAMGHPGTFHYLTPPCQSQVRVVPSCHGTTRDIPETSHYLTPPCQVQVVPSCHGTTQDIPGSSHYLIPPGPSCPKLPWDNPGHSTTLYHPASPRSELYQVAMGQPRTSWEVPTILYHPSLVPRPRKRAWYLLFAHA